MPLWSDFEDLGAVSLLSNCIHAATEEFHSTPTPEHVFQLEYAFALIGSNII